MLHSADIQSVVPGQVDIHHPDYEVRYRAVQQRRADAAYEADVHAFSRASGKVLAQHPLIFREHANAVLPSLERLRMAA